MKDFDLSEENIYRILKIIGNREKKIAPTFYSRTCGTTGLVIFLVKDTLEYCGILGDKKNSLAKIYKITMYLVEKLKKELALTEQLEGRIKIKI